VPEEKGKHEDAREDHAMQTREDQRLFPDEPAEHSSRSEFVHGHIIRSTTF
jgi:hypothetical protein